MYSIAEAVRSNLDISLLTMPLFTSTRKGVRLLDFITAVIPHSLELIPVTNDLVNMGLKRLIDEGRLQFQTRLFRDLFIVEAHNARLINTYFDEHFGELPLIIESYTSGTIALATAATSTLAKVQALGGYYHSARVEYIATGIVRNGISLEQIYIEGEIS